LRTKPPAWAESLLRLFLQPDVFASVSGDLIEQYRDSIHPARGRQRADRWYITQVFGLVLRRTWIWAALFAGSFVGRNALDLLLPTTDFSNRSQVSTALTAGILLAAGFRTGLRSGSYVAGAAAGLVTTIAAAGLSLAGSGVLLTIWHDPGTLTVISGSGGLAEGFLLPILLILPGVAIGTVGGAMGVTARWLVRTR
jgi:hypothetical protein